MNLQVQVLIRDRVPHKTLSAGGACLQSPLQFLVAQHKVSNKELPGRLFGTLQQLGCLVASTRMIALSLRSLLKRWRFPA